MNNGISEKKHLSIWYLAWPIAVEMFLQFLMGTADTLMVSHVSDYAVSAVGLSSQIINSMNVMFVMINSGAGIIIAQKLGSGKVEEARRTAALALKANLIVGILLSFMMFFSTDLLLRIMHAPGEILPFAKTYLSVVGSGMLVMALNAAASAIIRNTGNTRGTMLVSMGMNALHLVMNYALIFGAFGLPQMGIVGVTISTLISRSAALVMSLLLVRKAFEPRFRWSDWKGFDRTIVKEVWKVGWPMSINAASWNYTQSIIFAVVASMGSITLSAFTYMNTIQSLPWFVGMAVAMASQIRVGHLYGAKNYEACYRSAYTALWVGISYVLATSLLLTGTGKSVIGWFTSDANIIAVALPLFLINLVLQPLKMLNQAFGFSLNGIGDTRYTAMSSIVSMWAVAAGFTYLFGITLGMGIVGVYAAMICDETVRGILVAVRWKKRGRLPKTQSTERMAAAPKQVSL